MDINSIDLSQYKAKVADYILKKDIVINESYTVEDVLIVGLRTLAREKDWQAKHGSVSVKAKVNTLKQAIIDLGGDPEEYLSKM